MYGLKNMNKQPPKMFTGKDCLYIADILEATLTFAKKAKFYAKNVQNAKLRREFYNLEKELSSEYDTLLKVIGGNA